jgi:hypothetical protein
MTITAAATVHVLNTAIDSAPDLAFFNAASANSSSVGNCGKQPSPSALLVLKRRAAICLACSG